MNGQSSRTFVVASGWLSRASRTIRLASRPGRSRKWSSSTWPVSRRSSVTRPANRARRSCRLVLDELVEAVAAQDERLGRLDRDGGRGVRRAVEQGQLTEEVAPGERRDDRAFLALGRRQDDLDRARLDDVERVARVALVEDRLVLAIAPDPERRGAQGERLVVDLREERAAAERLDREARRPSSCLRSQRPSSGRHRRRPPLGSRGWNRRSGAAGAASFRAGSGSGRAIARPTSVTSCAGDSPRTVAAWACRFRWMSCSRARASCG